MSNLNSNFDKGILAVICIRTHHKSLTKTLTRFFVVKKQRGSFMSKKLYPSDISDEQFARMLPLLESVKKKTRPRKLSLYLVLNAILYVLKTSCQWQSLPKYYPYYRNVHYYFTNWRNSGILIKF